MLLLVATVLSQQSVDHSPRALVQRIIGYEHRKGGGTRVLDLVLSQRTRPGGNLLEPRHMWHGAEPFTFLAAHFRQNAAAATFSARQRLLPVANTGQALDVRVIHAQLGKKGDWEGGRLLLRLAMRARTTKQ